MSEQAPAETTSEAPPTPAGSAAPATAPVATEVPAVAEPEPEKPNLVAEVMKRRDVSQLASLVREKKALEADREKFKGHESRLSTLEKIERLMDDGDDAEAVMELLRFKHGDKAAERLAPAYNGLTKRVLGVQIDPQTAKVEQSVSRIQKQLDALKQEKAQTEAKLAERESEAREVAIQGAIRQVGSYLKTVEAEFPHLLAEADAPEEVVWGILEEAEKHGQELTLEQAAKLADEHFQPSFERRKARYESKNLLAPNKANEVPTKLEAPSSTKAAPPRKSLTNADASQAPTETAELPPPRSEQERRDRSFAVLQKSLNK